MAYRFNLIPLEERIVLDAAAAAVIYVNTNATGSVHNGTSWATAFTNLHDALASATSSTTPEQIWIAKGTYTPAQGTIVSNTDTFNLPSNVSLYGGFTGKESSLSQRNPVLNPTILSGDLNNNHILNTTDSLHVLTAINVSNILLDGLTITGGNAVGPSINDGSGGGIFIAESTGVTINNTTIVNNFGEFGGGISSVHDIPGSSILTITNSKFLDNTSSISGGGLDLGATTAGAVVNVSNTNFISNHSLLGGGLDNENFIINVSNSNFINNTADGVGGGILSSSALAALFGFSVPQSSVTDTNFIANIAVGNQSAINILNNFQTSFGLPPFVLSSLGGGAIDNGSNLSIVHSIFINNTAVQGDGGAILNNATAFNLGNFYLDTGAGLAIDNSTFIHNRSSTNGGAIASEAVQSSAVPVVRLDPTTISMTHSSFAANQATANGGALYLNLSTATVNSNLFALDSANSGRGIWGTNSIINGNLSSSAAALASLQSTNTFLLDDIVLS